MDKDKRDESEVPLEIYTQHNDIYLYFTSNPSIHILKQFIYIHIYASNRQFE